MNCVCAHRALTLHIHKSIAMAIFTCIDIDCFPCKHSIHISAPGFVVVVVCLLCSFFVAPFNLIEIEHSLDFNVNFIDFIKNAAQSSCSHFLSFSHSIFIFQLQLNLRANKTATTSTILFCS